MQIVVIAVYLHICFVLYFSHVYSGVSEFVFEDVISRVYELIIDHLSGKQQSACCSSECGWSSEAPHTVSRSWSLERYNSFSSTPSGCVFWNYYITESQFHPLPDFTRSSNHHRQSWNQGPAGRLPSSGGEFVLQDKDQVKIICGSLWLHVFLVCFVSLDLGSMCP